MGAVARVGDSCTGHGCWPPRTCTSGSATVFINGLGAHRQGDSWAEHCCVSLSECHASTLAAGSSTVFVNGVPIGRIGDPVACGSVVSQGSSSVFAGG